MSIDLNLSLLNLEAVGLQPDGSHDFGGLLRAFADPPALHLLTICECKFWHARGKTPFRTAIRQLSTLTGRHYVGELFTGPLGTAVIYDPTVLPHEALRSVRASMFPECILSCVDCPKDAGMENHGGAHPPRSPPWRVGSTTWNGQQPPLVRPSPSGSA